MISRPHTTHPRRRHHAVETEMEDDGGANIAVAARDLEIVGLGQPGNGRSCTQHSCCGESLCADDTLRLVKCVVEVDGRPEEAIKCVRISEGSDGCTVAFLPKYMLNIKKLMAKFDKQEDPIVQVVELYATSDSTQKRQKSYANFGMAACVFINEIPRNE